MFCFMVRKMAIYRKRSCESKTEVKDLINGEVVSVNFSADDRNSYQQLEDSGKIKYLGVGYYYTVDDVPQEGCDEHHFWSWSEQFLTI